jgi:hypothetical protein
MCQYRQCSGQLDPKATLTEKGKKKRRCFLYKMKKKKTPSRCTGKCRKPNNKKMMNAESDDE